jgi:quercetin 2,3-dioxygenase
VIRVIRSDQRHHENLGWLDARWHFSFSDYKDPQNMNWGALRVFNDDVISPRGGFDTHPHRDMEIVSYIVRGALRHRDSDGNDHVTRRGGVQVMSAGKGILHSEQNPSDDEPTRLLQLWIIPRTRGLTPRWAPKDFDAAIDAAGGDFVTLVSDGTSDGSLPIDRDATIRVARPRAGQKLSRALAPGRLGYLFVIDGKAAINGQELLAGDQARIADETSLSIEVRDDAELMFIDLPE